MARSLTLAGLVAGVHLATLDLRVAVRATPFPKHRKKFFVNSCLKVCLVSIRHVTCVAVHKLVMYVHIM